MGVSAEERGRWIASAYERAANAGITDGNLRLLVWMLLNADHGVDGPTYWRGRDLLVEGMGRKIPGETSADEIAAYESVKVHLRKLRLAGLLTVSARASLGSASEYRIHV